jgi:hypothetical protein
VCLAQVLLEAGLGIGAVHACWRTAGRSRLSGVAPQLTGLQALRPVLPKA